MTDIKKAFVTAVPFGSLTIEGLMDDDGKFFVAVTQLVGLELVPPNRSSKQLEALLGIPLKTHQFKTELSKNVTNAVDLLVFEKLIRQLDKQGNERAGVLVDAFVGLSLTQLFSDAFGIHFEVKERQSYAKQREVHRVNFRPKYTDHLKNDGCKNYAKEVNRLKLSAGVPLEPIETYNDTEVMVLNEKEVEYNLLRKLGYSHNKALRTI